MADHVRYSNKHAAATPAFDCSFLVLSSHVLLEFCLSVAVLGTLATGDNGGCVLVVCVGGAEPGMAAVADIGVAVSFVKVLL